MATAVVVFVFATLVECDGNGASGTNVDELPRKRVRTVCANMEQKICLYYDPTTKRLKKNPKNRRVYPFANNFVKYHIKEFHRKDHHHRLEKHVAYTLSVIALNRLEESAKALDLPTYFPRILEEINNYTYKIEHVGLQSDQIDVELEINEVKRQVSDITRILKHAGVMHMDYEPHCKNIVFDENTGRMSLIDWDIIALRSDVAIDGAQKMWLDENWYPNAYADRFSDMKGWDNVERRIFEAAKACLSPTCFCRASV